MIRVDETGPDGNVQPIQIASDSNIQDGVIIHSLGGTSVVIGQKVSVAHGVIIHGPSDSHAEIRALDSLGRPKLTDWSLPIIVVEALEKELAMIRKDNIK